MQYWKNASHFGNISEVVLILIPSRDANCVHWLRLAEYLQSVGHVMGNTFVSVTDICQVVGELL